MIAKALFSHHFESRDTVTAPACASSACSSLRNQWHCNASSYRRFDALPAAEPLTMDVQLEYNVPRNKTKHTRSRMPMLSAWLKPFSVLKRRHAWANARDLAMPFRLHHLDSRLAEVGFKAG